MSRSREQFNRILEAARTIARTMDTKDELLEMRHKMGCSLGARFNGPCVTYSDDVVEIVAVRDGPNLSIYNIDKKNPCLMVGSDGDPFRSHGDMWELEGHLLKLANPLWLLAAQAED